MRGTVTDAMIVGGSAVLAVDAESRSFVNVLDVATATVRLKKDVKIKGQLAYAELTPAGLLYISRPDPAANAERSEEHTSEIQSRLQLVCRLLPVKKKKTNTT